MASKQLFGGNKKKKAEPFKAPPANTTNEAGGRAYKRSDKEALAQLVMTGFLGDTFYVDAKDQLDQILKLSRAVEPEFLAKLAVEAREHGYMKDTPALLCAVLTTHGETGRKLLAKCFNRAIDNGKMLRNFVQIMRSGQVGRKSMGTHPKRLVREWLEAQTDERIFKNSIGNDPSLADVIKMVHPRPGSKSREALYAYLIGKDKGARYLPAVVKEFELFKRDQANEVPEVPFEMLTALELTPTAWKVIASRMTWQQLRQNLNSIYRHGAFTDRKFKETIADKLRDRELIRKAKVFPYQIYTSFMFADPNMPSEITDALQDALDISLENIPSIEDKRVLVVVDVSGSMGSFVTGSRGTATSKMRYVDVGSLIGAAYARQGASVWAVDTALYKPRINKRDSVATIASTLSKHGGGGTNLSLALEEVNRNGDHFDLILFVSDSESWADRYVGGLWGAPARGTGKMQQFERIKKANPKARMVNIDLLPATSKQDSNHRDILNVGGFSDRVFDVVSDFLKGRSGADFWIDQIEKVEL